MATLNKVMAIGHLGKDPETRFTPTGKKVCTFSLAANRNWTGSDGEKKEATDWFNIAAWGPVGETCQKYLKKGRLIYVEGRLQTRQYEEDGKTRWYTEIVIHNMQMLDKAPQHNGEEIENCPDEVDFVPEM